MQNDALVILRSRGVCARSITRAPSSSYIERLRDPAKSSLCAPSAMLSTISVGNASSARNSRRTFVTVKVGFSLIDKYLVKVFFQYF